MKHAKKNAPTYDLPLAKRLVSAGRRTATKKSINWLHHHGYDSYRVWDIFLSLEEDEFVESLPPASETDFWADVYRCSYADADLTGEFYVKFLIEGDEVALVVLSCKEWGYGW